MAEFKIDANIRIKDGNTDLRTLKELNTQVTNNTNGKAPTSHASTGSTYGLGTTGNYGHCKVINDLTHSSFANGEALSAYQGKLLNDNKQNKISDSGWIYAWNTSSQNYGRYRKIHNVVYIEVFVSGGTALTKNEYKTLMTLPSGYRPNREIYFAYTNISGGWSGQSAHVKADGKVELYCDWANQWYGFTLSFPADQ